MARRLSLNPVRFLICASVSITVAVLSSLPVECSTTLPILPARSSSFPRSAGTTRAERLPESDEVEALLTLDAVSSQRMEAQNSTTDSQAF